jgi:hypothetical protein
MQIITGFTIDQKHLRELKALAKREGQSASAIVRRALAEFLARERRKRLLAERRFIASVNTNPASPVRTAVAVADEERGSK